MTTFEHFGRRFLRQYVGGFCVAYYLSILCAKYCRNRSTHV